MSDIPKFKDWYEERYNMPFPGVPHELTTTVMQRLADAMAKWCDFIADAALERATGYAVGNPEDRDD